MTRFRLLVILLGIDMLFTGITRAVWGDWTFEANPLIPDHICMFVILTVYATAIACMHRIWFLFQVYFRAVALVSHILAWVLIGMGKYAPTPPVHGVAFTFVGGLLLPLLVILVTWVVNTIRRRY